MDMNVVRFESSFNSTTGGASSLFDLISMPHAIGRWRATNTQNPSFLMQGKQLENIQYILLMKVPTPLREWIGESNSEPPGRC
jgi:hypothetical protein